MRRWFRSRDVGWLEAPQQPIVPSPADGPDGPPAAQVAAAGADQGLARVVEAVTDLRRDRDELWGWCFESAIILHRVLHHGMDALTPDERTSVVRVSAALDRIVGREAR